MKCPGQDTQYWSESAIFEANCPKCSQSVEFFKDDTARICRKCGERFINPKMDFGCASYCEHASQCIGDLPEEAVKEFKDNLFKDKLALAVKKRLTGDFDRIRQISDVARVAEVIGKQEGGDLSLVLCVAYLRHVEISQVEMIFKEVSGNELQQIIVCDILRGKKDDCVENRIVQDAERVVFVQNELKNENSVDLKVYAKECLTVVGEKEILALANL